MRRAGTSVLSWKVLLAASLFVSGCADGTAAVSSSEQAVQEADDAIESAEPGEKDVIWDDEILGPETHGSRGPAKPADPVAREKLAQYFAALEAATEAWIAAGYSQAEIDELGGQLREQMMGERP